MEIRDEAIVDKAAGEAREKAEGEKGVGASFLVDAVPGDQLCAEGMEPVELSGHAEAALIAVSDRRLDQQVGHTGLKARKGGKGGGHGGLNGVLADGLAEEIGDHLSDPIKGNQLLCAEINKESVEVGAILGRDADVLWELCGHFAAGDGAPFDFHPVFGHNECLGRQVKDLTGVVAKDGLPAHRASATARAPCQWVNDNTVGMGDFQ